LLCKANSILVETIWCAFVSTRYIRRVIEGLFVQIRISTCSAEAIVAYSVCGAARILEVLDEHPLYSEQTWRAVIKYYQVIEPGQWCSPWLEMVKQVLWILLFIRRQTIRFS
jgi:hypothetical protein